MPQSRYHSAAAPRGRWVIAHRGVSGRYPENTMAAFRAAVDVGADFIELDVHLTADGEVVVMHDDKLGRTCTGSGKLAELSMDDIRRQDAGSWMSPQFAGERVPTFREVLAGIPLPVMCEIKPEGEEVVRRTAEVIRAAGAVDRVVLASFSDANLAWAAEMIPECERLALGDPDVGRDASIMGPNLNDVTAGVVGDAHAADRAVWSWTVDEPKDIRRAIDLGIDGIISNWAERVIDALR